MTRKLYHPLWTHLPALALLLAMILHAANSAPYLNVTAPTHFGPSWKPDAYGSPWVVIITAIGISALFLGLSILIDELWARQETRKTFNWMSWFDEAVVGLQAGMLFSYITYVRTRFATPPFVWQLVIITAVVAVLLAVLLEAVRPFVPHPGLLIPAEDTAAWRKELNYRIKSGERVAYWETQNPAYLGPLILVVSLLEAVAAVLVFPQAPWLSPILILIALVFWLPYGGLRVLVTREQVQVRLGVLGLRLLRLNISDLDLVQVHDFSPLRDFGGYGIRINREMKAYFFRGNRGVKVRTKEGKQYLIGSDTPERLAAVIETIRTSK